MKDRDNVILRFNVDSEKQSAVIEKYGLQGLRRPFFAFYYRSIDRKDIPIKKNVLRSHTYLHGTIIQKDPNSNITTMKAVTHSDYGGDVPEWLMQKYSSFFPRRVIGALEEAYKKRKNESKK